MDFTAFIKQTFGLLPRMSIEGTFTELYGYKADARGSLIIAQIRKQVAQHADMWNCILRDSGVTLPNSDTVVNAIRRIKAAIEELVCGMTTDELDELEPFVILRERTIKTLEIARRYPTINAHGNKSSHAIVADDLQDAIECLRVMW